ncbi:hypothetical protein KUV35_05725 [Marinobacter salsuginis]|uniref:hypothetical protein n=1 Tax=Marinobacter salsuginis TaxID=418719 RepID=UPI001C9861DC|nr:hypothetical protein [Marinobacter salsuginis]MBY6070779.1 hypothetical protein [Marinobacter salsuginis]
MTSRTGFAWLLLPLPAVVSAFVYTGLVFGSYSLGYIGLTQLWMFVFALGFGVVVTELSEKQQHFQPAEDASDARWDMVLLVLGALAVAALFYDRYFLRGIDYFSVGVAKSRAVLNQGDHDSSFFSVFGNFFLYSYLFPLIRSVLLWEERERRVRFAVITTALVELAGVSYVMGGRTAILLTIMVCLASFVVRRFLGKPYRPAFFSYPRLLLCASLAILAFGLFFWLRSRAFGDGNSFSYFLNICGHLTEGTALQCDFGAEGGPWKDLANYLHLVLLYGTHGTWLTEDIVQSGWAGGWITPQGLFSLFFSRLGAEAPAAAFEGFWVPGPASLLNDFGIVGMICCALVFGAGTGVLAGYLQANRINFAAYALVFAVSFWFLSFLIFPLNMPGFVISVWLGLFLWGAHQLLETIKTLISERYP